MSVKILLTLRLNSRVKGIWKDQIKKNEAKGQGQYSQGKASSLKSHTERISAGIKSGYSNQRYQGKLEGTNDWITGGLGSFPMLTESFYGDPMSHSLERK